MELYQSYMIPMPNLVHEQTELKTEWLLLQRCNLSNIGNHVYVTVRVRVRIRVMVSVRGYFQHHLASPGHGHLCLTGCSVVTIATAN